MAISTVLGQGMGGNEEGCDGKLSWTKRLPAIIGLSSLIAFAGVIAGNSSRDRPDFDDPSIRVVAALHEPIAPQNSVIYCGTMQMAWTAASEAFFANHPRFENAPDLVKRLNEGRLTSNDISSDAIFVWAATDSTSTRQEINKQLQSQFPDADFEVPLDGQMPSGLIAVACLMKSLRFQEPFEKLTTPVRFDDGKTTSPVHAFGIDSFRPNDKRHAAIAKQVEVVDYAGHGNFILRLKSNRDLDELILASVPPAPTLEETVHLVTERIKAATPGQLIAEDELSIPVVSIDKTHRFDELVGLVEATSGLVIAEALQHVNFQLDETGASLKSSARLGYLNGHRYFIFCKPFLICLRQSNSNVPYFAMWVGSSSVLQAAPETRPQKPFEGSYKKVSEFLK